MDQFEFRYRPRCSADGCDRDASHKIAAPWSFGAGRELKNYGLACDRHRESLIEAAQAKAAGLALAEGEQLGMVGAYRLRAGTRDADLNRTE